MDFGRGLHLLRGVLTREAGRSDTHTGAAWPLTGRLEPLTLDGERGRPCRPPGSPPRPDGWVPGLQICGRVHSCCSRPPRLWEFVKESRGNQDRDQAPCLGARPTSHTPPVSSPRGRGRLRAMRGATRRGAATAQDSPCAARDPGRTAQCWPGPPPGGTPCPSLSRGRPCRAASPPTLSH